MCSLSAVEPITKSIPALVTDLGRHSSPQSTVYSCDGTVADSSSESVAKSALCEPSCVSKEAGDRFGEGCAEKLYNWVVKTGRIDFYCHKTPVSAYFSAPLSIERA